jgi:hypothetical protein
MKNPIVRLIAPLVVALSLLVPVRFAAAEPLFVVVGSPPEQVEEYPSVTYENRPVYWVHNRWYYRDGDRWGYYREEPVGLRRYHHDHEFRERVRAHDARVSRGPTRHEVRREERHEEVRREEHRDRR